MRRPRLVIPRMQEILRTNFPLMRFRSPDPRISDISFMHNVPSRLSRTMAFQHPAPKMPISSFLLFISLSHLTAAASLIQPATTQNSSNPLAAPVCVSTDDWLGTRYGRHSCRQAVQRIISDEVDAHGEREFEFLAPHAEPIHTLPTMQTPRRYTGGPHQSSSSSLPDNQR